MLRRSAVTAGFALALTLVATPAIAQTGPGGETAAPTAFAQAQAQAAAAAQPAPAMIEGLTRDLGITAEQAATRLINEAAAAKVGPALREQLAAGFAGAWVTGATSTFVVATSDSTKITSILRAGAEAKLVKHSLAALAAANAQLDAAAGTSKSVPSWYVDLQSNSVVVLAADPAAAEAFVNASGADKSLIRVEASTERPRPLYDVRGGDAYYIGSGSRCSVGFSVTRGTQGGFASAGHCGTAGATTKGSNQVAQGTFQASSFPGNDYSWVAVNSNWTPTGVVNGYTNGIVQVGGSTDAAVGSSVCRAGSTTGWHCGTIQARNASVTYPEGTITGLIRTSVCAEPGDSGGSLISGSQAQGVTSGGSGNCTSGGTTYFQPINEILQAYGLTLTTGGTTPPPTGGCTGYQNTYTGSLTSNQSAYATSSTGYSAAAGVHRVCLDGPTGTDFDIYLQKLSGSTWTNVASGTTSGPDEAFTYTGTAGTYRVRVHAYSGSGSFSLGLTRP
ncbi:S1 family peptidase [Streptosporangium subroseum]|uniref:S1 family peptidase n=1 Tax=Streptosporangium subroseum TaxID=106412 RepID=UPI00308780E2|nr:S1 family peptidase [Streptosporangium subroseum]